MYSERMQLLLTPAQRRALRTEARRRGISVAQAVREAIDERYGAVPPEDRVEAARRIVGRAIDLPPDQELDRMLDDRFDLPAVDGHGA